MKQANRPKIQKAYGQILNKYSFLTKIIDVYSIRTFNELIENLFNQTLSFNHNQSKSNAPFKIECLMEIIEKQQSEITLNLIVKKVMVIFMLMRRLIREQAMHEGLQEMFRRLIDKILKEDIPKLTNPQQKRESSITKVYKYIRELSSSKDKYHYSKGKTIIEGQSDKGAVKEIVSHIIEPFCIYMLKILQNKDFYLTVFRPNHFGRNGAELPWKIINYSKMLGEIVYQLYRLSRYFITDLLTICIFMNLLCSKDLSLFYDILRECAQSKISQLREKISEVQNPQDEEREMIESKDVGEIKEFVKEIMAIKEKIHYIFGNKHCKDFKSYFSKPNNYSLLDQKNSEPFQFLLQFHAKLQKMQQKSKRLKKIERTNQINLFAESIFSQTQLSLPSSPQMSMEIYLGSENDYKLVDRVNTKSRMNSWLSRGEKGKLYVEQQVISTNGSS